MTCGTQTEKLKALDLYVHVANIRDHAAFYWPEWPTIFWESNNTGRMAAAALEGHSHCHRLPPAIYLPNNVI